MAEIAKLSFGVSVNEDNVNFHWSGYNDSMANYIEEILKRIIGMKTADLA